MIGFRRRTKLTAGCAVVLFAFVGLQFVAIGLFYRSGQKRLSARAQGRVVAVHAQPSDGGSEKTVLYKPEIEFDTADGRRFTFQSGLATSPPQFTVGEAVGVRYDPGDPARAEAEGFLTFGLPWLLIGAGVVSLALSVVCVGLLILLKLFG